MKASVVILTLCLSAAMAIDCTQTHTHFLSPHSLGKQDEITDALKVLCPQLQPRTTMYRFASANYTLYNISVKCIYNDGKQTANINSSDNIAISGGKIEFAVNFNYSVSKIGPDRYGYGYGKNLIIGS